MVGSNMEIPERVKDSTRWCKMGVGANWRQVERVGLQQGWWMTTIWIGKTLSAFIFTSGLHRMCG
jgi:hypothetical protein